MKPSIDNIFLHSGAHVTGATGVMTANTNVQSIERTGAGLYTVTLGSEIDPTQRYVSLIIRTVVAVLFIRVDSTVVQTDLVFGVRVDNIASAATDGDWGLIVTRGIL